MRHETAVAYLQGPRYRAQAWTMANWVPMAAIYWEDEIPEMRDLMKLPRESREQIYRRHGIRVRMWKKLAVSEEDAALWDEAVKRVPECPMFRRMEWSAEDWKRPEMPERNANTAFEALASGADEVVLREKAPGV